MRENLPNHPLVGKTVDFDWRNPKEQGQPYDKKNKNVVQDCFVLEVRLDCYGETWLYCENYAPQNEKRVCKVH